MAVPDVFHLESLQRTMAHEDRLPHSGRWACIQWSIRRGPTGAWCGYAELPERHPWMHLDYDDIPARVHGGLTFKLGNRIGFDCAHAGDLIPEFEATKIATGHPRHDVYRDYGFVVRECKLLCEQVFFALDPLVQAVLEAQERANNAPTNP